jgi:hypothetical protein
MFDLRNVGIACSNNPLMNNDDELFSFADNALLELKRQRWIALSFVMTVALRYLASRDNFLFSLTH